MRRLGLGVGLAGTLLAVACGGGGGGTTGGTNPNAVLQTVTVSPATAHAIPGATAAFTATGHYDDGSSRDVTGLATWSATPGTVATFPAGGAAGVATAVADGVATVTAAVRSVEGTAQLTVATPTFVSVRIAPTSPAVGVGGTVDLACIGRTDAGADVDVTALATWTTSDPLVATVSAGTVTGVKEGQASVGATFRGLSAAPVTVTVQPATLAGLVLDLPATLSLQAGADLQARAYARYSDGTQREVTPLAAWSSSAAGVVSVSDVAATRGDVKAVSTGGARITASFGGKSASADVTVVPGGLVSLLVDPVPYPLPAGVSTPLRATAVQADGSTADVTASATWTSNADVAQVSAAGVATTVAPGVAIVEATYGGLTGTTGFLVTGAAVSRLRWNELQPVTIAVGETYTPDVWLEYQDGSSWVVGDQADVVSGDPAIAVEDRDTWGRRAFRGVAPGSTVLTASYAGQTATLALNVVAATSMTLSAVSTVPLGVTAPVRAQTWLSGTSAGDVTELADWSSSAPGVISVSNAPGSKGQATALATTGTAVVTATFAGMTATRTLSAAGAVQSIQVSPASVVVDGAHQVTVQAWATVAGGAQVDVTDLASWWCDDLVAACWQGIAYGNAPGTTPVTASVGTVLGQGSVTVVDDPDAVAIRPALGSTRLPVGHAVQLSAVDTWQNAYPPRERPAVEPLAWVSDSPAVADFLDPAWPGLLTGVAPGFTYVHVHATTASGAQLTGTAGVTVDTLQGLSVGPITVAVGGSAPLAVTGTFAGGTGSVLPFVTWDVADATVLGTDASRAYGRKVGLTDVTATLDGLGATTPATVTVPAPSRVQVSLPRTTIAPGETISPKAYLVFDSGDAADVTGLATWSSTSGTTASVTGTPPVVEALAAGTAGVQASYAGFTGSANLTVAVPSVVQLDFYQPRIQLARGASTAMSAIAEGPGGATIYSPGPLATASAAPTVATVTTGGTYAWVTGVSLGSAVVTAEWGGATAVGVVDVVGDVGSIWFGFVDPNAFPLHVHQRYVLRVEDVSGLGDATEASTWTSSAPGIVKVNAPGQIEAVAPGLAYVTATAPRSAASIPVRVANAAVATIAVAGVAPMVPVGAEYACRATALFDDGASLLVTKQVTWTSADPTVADFDPARPGVLVGKKAGAVRVEAAIDGKVGGTDVTVY